MIWPLINIIAGAAILFYGIGVMVGLTTPPTYDSIASLTLILLSREFFRTADTLLTSEKEKRDD